MPLNNNMESLQEETWREKYEKKKMKVASNWNLKILKDVDQQGQVVCTTSMDFYGHFDEKTIGWLDWWKRGLLVVGGVGGGAVLKGFLLWWSDSNVHRYVHLTENGNKYM